MSDEPNKPNNLDEYDLPWDPAPKSASAPEKAKPAGRGSSGTTPKTGISPYFRVTVSLDKPYDPELCRSACVDLYANTRVLLVPQDVRDEGDRVVLVLGGDSRASSPDVKGQTSSLSSEIVQRMIRKGITRFLSCEIVEFKTFCQGIVGGKESSEANRIGSIINSRIHDETKKIDWNKLLSTREFDPKTYLHDNAPLSFSNDDDITQLCSQMRARLKGSVRGQSRPIEEFCTGINAILRNMLIRSKKDPSSLTRDDRRPLGVFMFCGPSGVGKTFLSELASEELAGYGFDYRRFDMTGYMGHECANYMIGFPKTYRAARPGDLTNYVMKHPRSVIVFDEIEKADEGVKHLFLQVLQEGTLYDNYYGEDVPFSNTILIFTTNAGRSAYEGEAGSDLSGISKHAIIDAIGKDKGSGGRSAIPSALLSRLAAGTVIMFNRLGSRDLLDICDQEFEKASRQYQQTSGIEITHDQYVPTALLLSSGGLSDARSVSGDARKFVTRYMGKLIQALHDDDDRNASSKKPQEARPKPRKVAFKVDLEGIEDQQIKEYFTGKKLMRVFCLAEQSKAKGDKLAGNPRVVSLSDGVKLELHYPDDLGFGSNPAEYPKYDDVCDKVGHFDAALIDIGFGQEASSKAVRYYGAMDIKTYGRRFFQHLHAKKPDMPIFIIRPRGGWRYPSEADRQIFLKEGARDFLDTEKDSFFDDLRDKIDDSVKEKNVFDLTRRRKVLKYSAAMPRASKGGGFGPNETLTILLNEFSLSTAPDSRDANDILCGLSIPSDSFDDVIGNAQAVDSLKKVSLCLKDPSRFLGNSLNMPRGVLLHGKPGTGKTMMARAMAHDADAVFIPTEANKLLAGGAPEIHRIFGVARRYAPAIVFIDEFDNIAQPRERLGVSGQAVVNALLTEMDGFKRVDARPVVVLAATNFAPDKLDAAAMRRFDTQILVTIPDAKGRETLIRRTIGKIPVLSAGKSAGAMQGGPAGAEGSEQGGPSTPKISEAGVLYLVNETAGWSPARIVDLINYLGREALLAGHSSASAVAPKDDDAWLRDRFELHELGEPYELDAATEDDVAIHESGHALVAYVSGLHPNSVTTISRASYLGLTKFDQREGLNISMGDILADVRVALGGRAAECIYYGAQAGKGFSEGISSSAKSDLSHATGRLLYALCDLGLDMNFGMAIYPSGQPIPSRAMDRANAYLLYEFSEARRILEEHEMALFTLAKELRKDKYLKGPQIEKVFDSCGVKFNSYVPASPNDDGRDDGN